MNKSIFKKIKRSHLQSINESPMSQEQIQFMSVEDMEKNLLTHMHSQKNDSSPKVIVSTDTFSLKSNDQIMSQQVESKMSVFEGSMELKKIPELINENDRLKDEIDKLKSERKLILSQYENVSASSKNYPTNKQTKDREYSFRKSVENIEKLLSSQQQQKRDEKPMRQNSFRQRQFGSIHQKIIPSSDSSKNEPRSSGRRLGTSLEANARGSNPRSSGSREVFSTLEERFYHYYKNEMVKMNTQNTKLNLKIGELQNKITTLHKQYELLEQQNAHIKALNQSLQEKLKTENQKIDKITAEMSTALFKKQQLIQSEFKILKEQLSSLRTTQQTLRKQLLRKDVDITSLKAELSKKETISKNYTQLASKNASLQNQVNELIVRNRKLNDKFRRIPAIDHLWEIKQVEYENLVNLLQQQKTELQEYSSFKNIQTKKSSRNSLDLTFSKDKTYY